MLEFAQSHKGIHKEIHRKIGPRPRKGLLDAIQTIAQSGIDFAKFSNAHLASQCPSVLMIIRAAIAGRFRAKVGSSSSPFDHENLRSLLSIAISPSFQPQFPLRYKEEIKSL